MFVFYKTDAHSLSFISWIQAEILYNFFHPTSSHVSSLWAVGVFRETRLLVTTGNALFRHSPIVRMREWRHWPAFSQLKTVITSEANFATLVNLVCFTYMSKVCCALLLRDALNFTENWQKSNGGFLGNSNWFKIMVNSLLQQLYWLYLRHEDFSTKTLTNENSKWYFKIDQK